MARTNRKDITLYVKLVEITKPKRKRIHDCYFEDAKHNDSIFEALGFKFVFSLMQSRVSDRKYTFVHAFSDENIPVATGFAILNPIDTHNTHTGMKTALADVLPQLELLLSERTKIWEKFFKFIKVEYNKAE